MEKNLNSSTKKILALETSGQIFSLGFSVSNDGQLFHKGSIHMDLGLRHSTAMHDGTRFLLKHCGIQKEELTHLAVSTGPGSFTGLRVGIAYARALSQGLRIPLIGISTFEVIARSLRKKGIKEPLAILISSIGEDVFAGLFPKGVSSSSGEFVLLSLSALPEKIQGKTVFAGDGFLRHEKEIRSAVKKRVLTVAYEENFPHAHDLAEIASLKIRKNELRTNSGKDVVPLYLRPPLVLERALAQKTLSQRKKQ